MKHREGTMLSRLSLSLFLSALALAGCATKSPAPVADRAKAGATPPVRAETPAAPAPVVARPGYYIVKPGDTLIRIALDHGQNYRDIAAWNGLENPNLIEVGQVLRVTSTVPAPPSAAAAAVAADTGVVTRPVASSSVAPASAASAASAPKAPVSAPASTASAASAPRSTTCRRPRRAPSSWPACC